MAPTTDRLWSANLLELPRRAAQVETDTTGGLAVGSPRVCVSKNSRTVFHALDILHSEVVDSKKSKRRSKGPCLK